jgi:hypothetical protein
MSIWVIKFRRKYLQVIEERHAQFPGSGVPQVFRRISLLCTYSSLKSLWQLLGEMSEGQLLKIDLPLADLDSSQKRYRFHGILIS